MKKLVGLLFAATVLASTALAALDTCKIFGLIRLSQSKIA